MIEKNKVIDIFIEGDGDDEFTAGYNYAVSEYKEKINAIPDVQIVKHCPNCGAKMDGDNNA